MKVAFVVQRWGEDVIGGAEAHARILAQHLVEDLQWVVDVVTTTAKDQYTWANEFACGVSSDGKIKIIRFAVHKGRSWFFKYYKRGFQYLRISPLWSLFPAGVKAWLEELWYRLQGPYSPDLISFLQAEERNYDCFLFMTYLYHPTVYGLPTIKDRMKILIPTAHDEPPLYFASSSKLFAEANYIYVNSNSEAELIKRIYPKVSSKIVTVGVGLESAGREWAKVEATKPPYAFVLFLGRIDKGKRCDLLINYFLDYVRTTGDDKTKLILAGKVDEHFSLPDHPQVRCVGPVSGLEKETLLQNAACIVSASVLESLSLLTLEALKMEKPVLMADESQVAGDFRSDAPSVLFFKDSASFARNLAQALAFDRQPSDSWSRKIATSKKWVESQYSWSSVLEPFRMIAKQITERN